jgi:hypothetical protein
VAESVPEILGEGILDMIKWETPETAVPDDEPGPEGDAMYHRQTVYSRRGGKCFDRRVRRLSLCR